MKFIHCADVHLGSRIDSKFSREVSESKREEVRNTFKKMVEYAKEQGVQAILLSGDVFDSDTPFKKDATFFYSVIEKNPEVDFLYLRGNHDGAGERRDYKNLKTFGEEWTSYDYGDVVISGIEMERGNATSLYSALALNAAKKNIVMLHGQIADATGMDKIQLSRLRDKGIDYLALGHVHAYAFGALDARGTYAYSGCLEGRGFDETGEKGFILLDVDGRITHRFIPFSLRKIERVQVDVTGLSEGYMMAKRARECTLFSLDTIYRVELVGEVDATVEEFSADVQRYLQNDCLFVSVKDGTKRKIDYAAYAADTSVYGEFVRTVQASEEFTDEEKAQIVAYGLRALTGREVDV